MIKHEHLIKAFEDGKRIQYRVGSIYGPLSDVWETVDAPQWHHDGEYRIHPDDTTNYHVHHDLIIAWAKGAEIQYFDKGYKEWVNISEPSWLQDVKYRIKPIAQKFTYRVALLKNASTGTFYTNTTDATIPVDLENHVNFVRWLTNEIEVEI